MTTQKKAKAKDIDISQRLQELEKERQLSNQQIEAKAKKVEQHDNMLKSLGIDPKETSKQKDDRKIGIINPFALTEAILESPINWKNPRAMDTMERVLESSFEDLIHNKDSVLFAGTNDKNVTVRKEPDSADIKNATSLEELKKAMDNHQVNITASKQEGKKINIELNIEAKRDKALSDTHLTKAIKDIVIPTEQKTRASDNDTFYYREQGLFTPYSRDRHRSITQGAVGNCYFIAALHAIAWTHPGILNIDVDFNSVYTPLLYYRYFRKGHSNTYDHWVRTDSRVFQKGDYKLPIYARSRRWFDGDYWVAHWEQLYAKFRFPSKSPLAAIQATAGGIEWLALKELSGSSVFATHAIDLKNTSVSQLKSVLWHHTDGYWKTIHPMVLGTFSTNLQNLPIGHAYSVLGVQIYNGEYYVIIRNPWGNTEPSGPGMLGGTYLKKHFATDESYTFSENDGVFAMKASLVLENFDRLSYLY